LVLTVGAGSKGVLRGGHVRLVAGVHRELGLGLAQLRELQLGLLLEVGPGFLQQEREVLCQSGHM
jgi:hypothetical protein